MSEERSRIGCALREAFMSDDNLVTVARADLLALLTEAPLAPVGDVALAAAVEHMDRVVAGTELVMASRWERVKAALEAAQVACKQRKDAEAAIRRVADWTLKPYTRNSGYGDGYRAAIQEVAALIDGAPTTLEALKAEAETRPAPVRDECKRKPPVCNVCKRAMLTKEYLAYIHEEVDRLFPDSEPYAPVGDVGEYAITDWQGQSEGNLRRYTHTPTAVAGNWNDHPLVALASCANRTLATAQAEARGLRAAALQYLGCSLAIDPPNPECERFGGCSSQKQAFCLFVGGGYSTRRSGNTKHPCPDCTKLRERVIRYCTECGGNGIGACGECALNEIREADKVGVTILRRDDERLP